MCIVINLFGAPGSGKSTTMARLFSDLKQQGVNCEMVSEFAKDLVYEDRMSTMKDELYIFAKQQHRMFRVKDKVDVIITDRPLLLTCIYANLYDSAGVNGGKDLDALVDNIFNQYNNINILLKSDVDYKTEGRLQNKNESQQIHDSIVKELELKYSFDIFNTTDYDSIKQYVDDKLLS